MSAARLIRRAARLRRLRDATGRPVLYVGTRRGCHEDLIACALESGLLRPRVGELTHVLVGHDDDCALLVVNGDCSCSPEILSPSRHSS